MRMTQILMALSLLVTTGCSPFGNETVASVINSIAEIFSGTTTADVNSGGSDNLTTSDNHQVSMTVGNTMSQTSTMVSSDGHEVDITLSSE